MQATAKLVAPYMDKGYSLQLFNSTPELRSKVLSTFQHPHVKRANPFLQGDSDNWLMVEFWTNDRDIILDAVLAFQDALGLPVSQS